MKRSLGMILLLFGLARMVSILAFPSVDINKEAPVQDSVIAGCVALFGIALMLSKPRTAKSNKDGSQLS